MLVRDIYVVRHTEGEVGIEIEAEGTDLPGNPLGWVVEHDGSLRGPDKNRTNDLSHACEYVLPAPVARDKVKEVLHNLEAAYEENDSQVANSYRCSTHVHINVQELHMNQVYNFIVLYAMFEEFLVQYCGEERVGNLFCLRFQDAEAVIPALIYSARYGHFRHLGSDKLRYSALNVASMAKYGSLEFRAMRGTREMEEIETWVKLLLCLKDTAVKYERPQDLVAEMSVLGAEGLARKTFGDLVNNLPLEHDWEEIVWRNMREVQDLAYCSPWENNEKEKELIKEAVVKNAPDLDEEQEYILQEIPLWDNV